MVYKITSSDRLIAKIFRDFKPSNSNWIGDAIDWIGEGLEIMGIYTGLERKPVCLNVVDYKVKIPCNLETLEGIEYQGFRLPYSNSHNTVANCCLDLPEHTTEYCSFNPNYIQTSFAEGEIKVHGLFLPLDCNGFPMIPDNPLCLIALEWHCMSMMLLRGFKHPVVDYKYANMMWEKYYPQAQNDCNYPDLERYEQFRTRWTSLVLNVNAQNEFFSNALNTVGTETESGTITSAI